MPDKILLFHQKSSHNAFRPHISLLPSKMAGSPAISMYRLPTYYEDMAVPLPKCMYSLPSYFQTNSEMEVSRLILIVCLYKQYFLSHVDFPEAAVFSRALMRISYYSRVSSHRSLQQVFKFSKADKKTFFVN